MNDNYIITIIGTQTVDGESDSVEVITTGSYCEDGDTKIVRYTEYGADDPTVTTDTTVTVEGDRRVVIDRRGVNSSRLELERGRRHQCAYETPMGQLMIGVFTDQIIDTLSPSGGDLRASYQLDFYSDVVSNNEFHINIKEKDHHVKD